MSLDRYCIAASDGCAIDFWIERGETFREIVEAQLTCRIQSQDLILACREYIVGVLVELKRRRVGKTEPSGIK